MSTENELKWLAVDVYTLEKMPKESPLILLQPNRKKVVFFCLVFFFFIFAAAFFVSLIFNRQLKQTFLLFPFHPPPPFEKRGCFSLSTALSSPINVKNSEADLFSTFFLPFQKKKQSGYDKLIFCIPPPEFPAIFTSSSTTQRFVSTSKGLFFCSFFIINGEIPSNDL